MQFTAHDWVAHHALHRPDALALRCAEDGRTITWSGLEDRVGRLATVLREHGVGRGDRVALIAENDPRVFEAQFAAMRIGAILVPLNWRLTPHEIAEIWLDCAPAVLVHDETWAGVAAEVTDKASVPRTLSWSADGDWTGLADAAHTPASHENRLDDVVHILYTSGTTGRPKGALGSHGTLVWQALNTAHTTLYSLPGNHHLNPMPLFHAGGLNVMANPILYFGGAVTTMTRFVPDTVLAALSGSTPPVTHFAAIPLMYQAVAGQPGFADADLSHARQFIVAGAIATPELLTLWADRGVPLQPQYGGTEMGPMATALDAAGDPAHQAAARAGSTGRAALHTDVRIVGPDGTDVAPGETGELWLRGPSITLGYWGKERSDYFTDDWLRTGDAARRDADGFYYLAGRTKEMYKSGGENVYPAEIENVLSLHPSVADVAVVGVPDPTWGEVGAAVVVPRGTEPTLEELNAFAGDRLARFKLPRHLMVVADLPRNVTGKVNRAELRARWAPGTAEPAGAGPAT